MARQLSLVIALILSTFSVHADDDGSNFYYGINVGGGGIRLEDGFATANSLDDDQSDIKDVGFTLGFELSSFLSLEGQIGIASNDNSSIIGDGQVYRAAGLARLNYPADKVNAYLLGGIGIAQYDFGGITEDEVGVAIGAGLDLFGNDTTALSLGVLVQPGDEIDYSVINVGFRHYFGGAK